MDGGFVHHIAAEKSTLRCTILNNGFVFVLDRCRAAEITFQHHCTHRWNSPASHDPSWKTWYNDSRYGAGHVAVFSSIFALFSTLSLRCFHRRSEIERGHCVSMGNCISRNASSDRSVLRWIATPYRRKIRGNPEPSAFRFWNAEEKKSPHQSINC